MSSVIADAEARLSRPGKERELLWGTSLVTAIYDDGEQAQGMVVHGARIRPCMGCTLCFAWGLGEWVKDRARGEHRLAVAWQGRGAGLGQDW